VFERLTDEARRVVELAQHEARGLRHPHLGTEHLLLGLLTGAGIAGEVLRSCDLTADDVRAEITRLVTPPLGVDDAAALAAIGIDLDVVRERVEAAFGVGALERSHGCDRRGPRRRRRDDRAPGYLRLTPRAKKVLELSLRESLRLRSGAIGTEHILLGLLREGEGLAARVLCRRSVDLEDLRRRVHAALDAAA